MTFKNNDKVTAATDPHAARVGIVIVSKWNPDLISVMWDDGENTIEHVSTLRKVECSTSS